MNNSGQKNQRVLNNWVKYNYKCDFQNYNAVVADSFTYYYQQRNMEVIDLGHQSAKWDLINKWWFLSFDFMGITENVNSHKFWRIPNVFWTVHQLRNNGLESVISSIFLSSSHKTKLT